jgi:hypothetical protein
MISAGCLANQLGQSMLGLIVPAQRVISLGHFHGLVVEPNRGLGHLLVRFAAWGTTL